MPYKFNFRQKSPKRRFLLILGFATFVGFTTLGLMVMFWGRLGDRLNLPATTKWLLGGLMIIYGALRFSRLFRVGPEDEE